MHEFKGSKDEALFLMRLVNAWRGTQDTQDALRSVLNEFKLLKANDGLDTDRVIALAARLKQP